MGDLPLKPSHKMRDTRGQFLKLKRAGKRSLSDQKTVIISSVVWIKTKEEPDLIETHGSRVVP